MCRARRRSANARGPSRNCKRALVTVFLTPPSVAVLAERLNKRNTDAAAEIQKRLALARQEIAQWRNFDYLLESTTKLEDLRRMLEIISGGKDACGPITSATVNSKRGLAVCVKMFLGLKVRHERFPRKSFWA
jgi:hypothetical protein